MNKEHTQGINSWEAACCEFAKLQREHNLPVYDFQKDFIRSVLSKERAEGEVRGFAYAEDAVVVSVDKGEHIDEAWERLQRARVSRFELTLPTDNTEVASYVCGVDRRPRWVTKANNIVISDEQYTHQDGNFSNLCATPNCRCSN